MDQRLASRYTRGVVGQRGPRPSVCSICTALNVIYTLAAGGLVPIRGRIRSSAETLMGQNPLASENEIKELTDQFFVTLRAYVARLSAEDERRSPKSFAQIEDLLKDDRPKQWSDAYQIEQLIVDLFDDRTLEVELQSRLLEAESNLSPSLAAQYAKLIGGLKTPGERRAVLARMVNDLQWRHTVNEVKRSHAKAITKTTGFVFIASIAAFALTIAALAFMDRGASYF